LTAGDGEEERASVGVKGRNAVKSYGAVGQADAEV
jgi:hypothetical protein